MPTSWNAGSLNDMGQDWRNVYQLAAVIVHSGDAYSGHFVTYRRGYQNSKYCLQMYFNCIVANNNLICF